MKRPSIATVFIASFGFIGIAFAVITATSFQGFSRLNEQTRYVFQNKMPKVIAGKDLELAVERLHMAAERVLRARSDEGEAKLQARLDDFEGQLNSLRPLFVTPAGRSLFARIDEAAGTYRQMIKDLLSGTFGADNRALLESDSALIAPIEELLSYNSNTSAEAYNESLGVYRLTVALTALSIGSVFAVALVAAFYSFAGVIRPIKQITGSMSRLSAGDTAASIPCAGRTDEIGEMAAAVETFRQNAVAAEKLEDEARRHREAAEFQRHAVLADEQLRMKVTSEVVEALGEGLQHLAAGDLAFRITKPFPAGFAALKSDFNGSIARMAETIAAVSSSVDALADGSIQLKKATANLASRSEQQAVAIEQSAAALDEITVTVSKSAARAAEAKHNTEEASRSALRANGTVSVAVEAMDHIESSSGQIAGILGKIDEIAFTTNLLALNAGVEAARAGDAGKGFAVVAQEVRELAQKSARAAREIKELVLNSGNDVARGVGAVVSTGDALAAIESFIGTINGNAELIATAAREQALALQEVTAAVNETDGIAQQNAAMVEKLDATTSVLAEEGARLRVLVGTFRLHDVVPATADLQAA